MNRQALYRARVRGGGLQTLCARCMKESSEYHIFGFSDNSAPMRLCPECSPFDVDSHPIFPADMLEVTENDFPVRIRPSK